MNLLNAALLCFVIMAATTTAAGAAGVISGRVVDGGEQGLPGVFVTAQHDTSRIETTVYTGNEGRYALPALAAGAYHVRVHHARYEDAKQVLALTDAGASVNLALSPAADGLRTASTATWFAGVPDGAQKREFILNCATCHEVAAARIMKNGVPRDHAKWLEAF